MEIEKKSVFAWPFNYQLTFHPHFADTPGYFIAPDLSSDGEKLGTEISS